MAASLDELRAFAAVYETGGFTAASKRLVLTTNAVSLRVQKLERDLGARLFVRTTRSVAPTEEGRTFYARVSRVLADLEEAEEELRPTSAGLRGTVRLAIPGTLATAPLLARLRALLEQHPLLSIQTRVASGAVDLVAEGVDIGVVVGQLPETTFVGRLLGRATWVLAAAPSYLDAHGRPRTPAELSGHRCLRLLSNPPQDEWTLVDRRGREVTVQVRGGYEADDSRALGDAAYAGLGIGVRPAGECDRAQREARLERVLPGYRFQPLDVYALVPKGRLRVPRVAACLEALRAAVGELA
ncbi:MAG: LysR family transcriptional regulator [Deltaproteobacteria bacterium]|nr:LysR family transcriptional regulator [Deltaproteobacteria bacterium]